MEREEVSEKKEKPEGSSNAKWRTQQYCNIEHEQARARSAKPRKHRYFSPDQVEHLATMGFRPAARDQFMLKSFHLLAVKDGRTLYYILKYNHVKKAQGHSFDFIVRRIAELVEARQCGIPPDLW